MMLVPQAKSSLCVGLGSGITLGTLALYDEIEDLSCVEIVPSVIGGARYFYEQNRNVLTDPRVNMSVGDGVQYLLTTRKRFDIISSDSKLNPEYSGNAPLLSTDYYELCRDRLSEAGVMVQWLAAHTPNSEMEVIARSFIQVFPYAALYWFDPYSILMAGSKSPLVFDMDAARAFAAREGKLSEDLKGLLLSDPYISDTLFIADRDRLAASIREGPTNSWLRPRLEFSITKEFRRKQMAYHEDQNILWLRHLRMVSAQKLRGEYDEERLQRFYLSTGKLLDAFGSGGGLSRLDKGLGDLEAGAALNPEDIRMPGYKAAINALTTSLENALAEGRVDEPEDLVRLGLARLDAGRPEEALDFFHQALAKKPDDPNIQYNIIKVLLELERWTELRPVLAKFKDDFPRDARGYSMQGRMHAANGELEPARAEFAKAVELDPQSLVYRNNLATALARLERYGEAADAFAQVCELDPAYQGAAFFAAASYSMAGRNKEAAHWLRFCLERNLATKEQVLESAFFENLKSSEYWEPALLNGPND
jgi:spermidine synthase/thioredoxin-like negative regulator of GroEL